MSSSSTNELIPGLSRWKVGPSVPHMAANLSSRSGRHSNGGCCVKLYSMPLRCCSSVKEAQKSKLKSPPTEDAQGNVQLIRRLYPCSFASEARETAQSITSWLARCTAKPLKPSAIDEQEGQPAVKSGPNIKW